MPAAAKHFAVPKPGVSRPPLPTEVNPHIRAMDTTKPPPVKFQEIMRDGVSTIVGRVKIPTPGGGHAFILRRLDTGAISVTTMFRAAFPTASEEAEKSEVNWIKQSFDTSGANKSGKARFAGHWVTPDVALYLAEGYHLSFIIPSLASAVPDPNTTFRRSKNQQPTPTASPAAEPGPAPAKRRREASPAAPVAAPVTAPPPAPVETPVSPPPSRKATSPTPRRSTRLRSPPAASLPTQPLVAPSVTPKTPRSRRAPREEMLTPAGSDETAVDEDAEAARIAEPKMHEDIQEQKELIAKLKADRAAAKTRQQDVTKSASIETETTLVETEEPAGTKRVREEEKTEYRFNFKEPGEGEVGERAIATNSRVRLLSQLPPERKSLAWGALAFAAGLGAVTFLPNLQGILF
ncbi:hypothetical protein L226DRAFT_462937 [Lentinus tigrinus ALCF2SS1-7]|uniref:HTH APSES-type domain-containing protein n=1 Tax=Lentinus tigrinus ALCF2SS1-6 TaxID=1328759 RepID=A0A5C2SAD2_9APHY|nr:hypothetical protein L227DRAFT_502346 [Lentinus tigrinus ALCF2SS1-6]RPD74822.1 hypothetical protein L226DRAFT_462937 [Lentinus tigrinus ALCF2SS1-7]